MKATRWPALRTVLPGDRLRLTVDLGESGWLRILPRVASIGIPR